jgi:carboxyl-terminal processing protease
MRAAAALLLLLVAGPAWGQSPARPGGQVQAAAQVLGVALAFIVPRALEPVPVQQLVLWGLAAPGSLDGSLTVEIRDKDVVLLQSNREVTRRPMPADGGAEAWGVLAASVLDAALPVSAPVREAGLDGLMVAFFDEMFNHLDPYSRYVPPGAADADRARRTGEAGTGMVVRRAGGALIVAELMPGSPAAAAGVRVGDRLVSVDDAPVAGEDADTVQSWLSGDEGSEVTLVLRRGPRTRTLVLERAVTVPETVVSARAGPVLVLKVSGFNRDTDQRFGQALTEGLGGPAGRGVKGLVVDLRGNRGGLLRQAVSATDLLLRQGVVATTSGRDKRADHEWRASGGDVADGRPVVVLVDGRSASAAEIMAAALADQGRAVVVGSSTLGKGLVQTVVNLPDGGELFVSWSRVLAPAGWPIQTLGVLPQVCTSLGQDAMMRQLEALDRGVQPMEAALRRHRAARAPLPAAEAVALRAPCPAAEAREPDMEAARYLIAHPAAYGAALLRAP